MNVYDALDCIHVRNTSYEEWLDVGMALHKAGFPVDSWIEWSKNDERFVPGECEEKWKTFNKDHSKPVTINTIFRMAYKNGYTGFVEDWDKEEFIETVQCDRPAVEETVRFLKALYKENEYVGYCTSNPIYDEKADKYKPSNGVYSKTAGDIIKAIEQDGLTAAIGECIDKAGAWIRINPLDGKYTRNENVTDLRYVLVESDTLSKSEQMRIIKQIKAPVVIAVDSAGRSIHFVLRIEAKNKEVYDSRVSRAYSILKKNGFEVDEANKNPSRYMRLPGVTRNGKLQHIVGENMGCSSWQSWMDFIEGVSFVLPDEETLYSTWKDPPEPPPEIIDGILRKGHKMLISSSSKAGKSFLLMELAICMAEGISWIDFKCHQGKVLYVNLEIDSASCIQRFHKIYEAKKLEPKNTDNIVIWNLRGHALPLDVLTPLLIRRAKDEGYQAVIIDPIYKILTGDENNASDMGAFCNNFDKICTSLGASVIYCHHHSKGAQGNKKAIDRASGSGVFARDPDAQIDLVELNLTEDVVNNVRDDYATGWQMEFSLREFKNPHPKKIWFKYPIHELDKSDNLKDCHPIGSSMDNLSKSKNYSTSAQRKERLDAAFDACVEDGIAVTSEMAEYIGVDSKTINRYVDEFPSEYARSRGKITKNK